TMLAAPAPAKPAPPPSVIRRAYSRCSLHLDWHLHARRPRCEREHDLPPPALGRGGCALRVDVGAELDLPLERPVLDLDLLVVRAGNLGAVTHARDDERAAD